MVLCGMEIIQPKPLAVGDNAYMIDIHDGPRKGKGGFHRHGLMGARAVKIVRIADNGRVQVQALQGAVRRPLWIDRKQLA